MQVLSNSLIRLKDLNPLIRNNNNANDALSVKAGPQALMPHPNGGWIMIFEAVSDTINAGGGAFDNTTGFMLATAPSLQGPWTISPSTRVLDPTNFTTWERYEISPSSGFWDADNNRWVVWLHGGNNSGPRKLGVAYSTDGKTGQVWSREAGNPILSPGTSGSFDDNWLADLKVRKLPNGTYLGFYRGMKVGGPSFGTIGRVTGSSPASLTKSGQVIAQGSAGAWNELGVNGGGWVLDPEGRIHLFVSGWKNDVTFGNIDQLGYYYSDDLGLTWTQYGSNPVLTPGASGAADYPGVGDVVQCVDDGDVLVITAGNENTTNYPTNPPLRGVGGYITPYRKTNPSRTGKFFLPSAYCDFSSKASVLNNTVFTVFFEFRAYRTDRTLYRYIYDDTAAFNITHFVRLQGGGGANAGKLHCWTRTPTGFTADMYSTSPVDDGQRHIGALIRRATNDFTLILDGAVQQTDSTTVGTDPTATNKAIGNSHPLDGNGDQPSYCTLGTLGVVLGTALTWLQILDAVYRRSYPAGVTPTIQFPETLGTVNGDVATVDASWTTPSPIPFRGRRLQSIIYQGA